MTGALGWLLLAATALPGQEPPAYPPDIPGAAEFIPGRFLGHEPVYLLAGDNADGSKFQLSFRYRLLNPKGSWVTNNPKLAGMHLAFTHTALWDTGRTSEPFRDASYRPEFFYETPVTHNLARARTTWQAGFTHESNGKSGADSRSLNTVFVRPLLRIPLERWHADLSARLSYQYALRDNPDLRHYRGPLQLSASIGRDGGPELALRAQVGDTLRRGSYQLDYAEPLRGGAHGNLDLYLYAQFFSGWAESLLEYRSRTRAIRIGVALVR